MNMNPIFWLYVLLDGRAIFTAVVTLTAIAGVRALNQRASRPWSYLAVVSAIIAALNPAVLFWIQFHLHFPYSVGGESMKSFAAGLTALIVGVAAVGRIAWSKTRTRGYTIAMIGMAGGAAWVVYWVKGCARMTAW
jgi:hypothetical protein